MALINVKSKYILKQIFNHINLNIFLNIIRHNKSLQQKLDININDYKIASSIKIDIIPKSNSNREFINLHDKNKIHIYLMIIKKK